MLKSACVSRDTHKHVCFVLLPRLVYIKANAYLQLSFFITFPVTLAGRFRLHYDLVYAEKKTLAYACYNVFWARAAVMYIDAGRKGVFVPM